jgi:DNA-binding LytR/AlgR family response regulator
VATTFLNGENIINEINRVTNEIYLIDYRLPTNNNGIEVAIEILVKFPSARILFITGCDHLQNEISKNPIFMLGPFLRKYFLIALLDSQLCKLTQEEISCHILTAIISIYHQ